MYSPAKSPAASATNRSQPLHRHLTIRDPTSDLAILPRHLLIVDQTANKFIQPIQQFATWLNELFHLPPLFETQKNDQVFLL
jgi:hypothetical protein